MANMRFPFARSAKLTSRSMKLRGEAGNAQLRAVSRHANLREVLVPGLSGAEPYHPLAHGAWIEVVHDEQPGCLIDNNRVRLRQQTYLRRGIEGGLCLLYQFGE